ncbi:mucin-3A [Hoplias malabaricus]|uniref:mucin-3A n=1 Tax=Hoplias malabaricus TaxID=27720 RepID=UPI0034619D15
MKNYIPDYENLNSQASKNLTAILTSQLSALCKRADAQNFKAVQILKLTQGSVIVNSTVQYNYPNNQSQIHFLNNNLESELQTIFNNSNLLMNLSEALEANVSFTEIRMEAVAVANISDLRQYLNCSLDFANFTLINEEGSWVCAGPCKSNPIYCSDHGLCLNEKSGPMCQCYKDSFEEFHGPQCDLYRRTSGFYAVLFGSLAGAIILLIIVIIVILVLRRSKTGNWSFKSKSDLKRLSFCEEEFFDFSSQGYFGVYNPYDNSQRREE